MAENPLDKSGFVQTRRRNDYRFIKNLSYSVYIVANRMKTVLYVGVTNDLCQRLCEHYLQRGKPGSFAGRYRCHYLIFLSPLNISMTL